MDPLSLVTLAKTIVDTLAGLKKLAPGTAGESPKAVAQVEHAFADFRTRLSALVVRLDASEDLLRLLPVWIRDFEEIDVWKNMLDEEDAQEYDRRLRRLVSESLHDHFAALTTRAKYESLDGIPELIDDFHDRLAALERELQSIPAGNVGAWNQHWPTLKVRLGDLGTASREIERRGLTLRGELLQEMRRAATAGAAGEGSA